jgi:hypothetical protein
MKKLWLFLGLVTVCGYGVMSQAKKAEGNRCPLAEVLGNTFPTKENGKGGRFIPNNLIYMRMGFDQVYRRVQDVIKELRSREGQELFYYIDTSRSVDKVTLTVIVTSTDIVEFEKPIDFSSDPSPMIEFSRIYSFSSLQGLEVVTFYKEQLYKGFGYVLEERGIEKGVDKSSIFSRRRLKDLGEQLRGAPSFYFNKTYTHLYLRISGDEGRSKSIWMKFDTRDLSSKEQQTIDRERGKKYGEPIYRIVAEKNGYDWRFKHLLPNSFPVYGRGKMWTYSLRDSIYIGMEYGELYSKLEKLSTKLTDVGRVPPYSDYTEYNISEVVDSCIDLYIRVGSGMGYLDSRGRWSRRYWLGRDEKDGRWRVRSISTTVQEISDKNLTSFLTQLGNHIDITIMYPAACIFSISLMGDYGFFSHLRI